MSIDIKAPTFPESVADGTVATWHKQPGEACSADELIVDIFLAIQEHTNEIINIVSKSMIDLPDLL